MRTIGVLIALASIGVPTYCAFEPYQPRNGDIVFQESRSQQSSLIKKVTGSRYSHMGIVFMRQGAPLVFEAVEPVTSTPLDEWIKRGVDARFVVKRLTNSTDFLTSEALLKMYEIGREFSGRHYDLLFEWSDDRLYCSELVWKIYQRALDVELAELRPIADFDLSDPEIQKAIQRRWGRLPPTDQMVVPPSAIFDSDLLVTVYKN